MALPSLRRRDDRSLTRFEDAFSDMLERFFGPSELVGERQWVPALDIAERDDAVVVRAELPGMKADDVEVTVQGNTLTIRGEKKEQHEDKGETYYRTERRYGNFRRDILLSSDVDAEKTEASCRDGVLTVTVPKSPAAKSRKINVKTS